MDENIELLVFLYKNTEMGVFSTNSLINKIQKKENKIKSILEDELKIYEDYYQKVQNMLDEANVDYKGINPITKITSEMGIKMETMKDNSDAALAQMLVEGMTMGIVTATSKIKNYEDKTDKKIIKLTKDYINFQENEINKLKKFM